MIWTNLALVLLLLGFFGSVSAEMCQQAILSHQAQCCGQNNYTLITLGGVQQFCKDALGADSGCDYCENESGLGSTTYLPQMEVVSPNYLFGYSTGWMHSTTNNYPMAQHLLSITVVRIDQTHHMYENHKEVLEDIG